MALDADMQGIKPPLKLKTQTQTANLGHVTDVYRQGSEPDARWPTYFYRVTTRFASVYLSQKVAEGCRRLPKTKGLSYSTSAGEIFCENWICDTRFELKANVGFRSLHIPICKFNSKILP